MKQISVFLGVLAALIAAGLALTEGASPVLLGILALAAGYTALVGVDSWRRHRASIRRRVRRFTQPRTAAHRARRKGVRR
jgi:hypothetical protein